VTVVRNGCGTSALRGAVSRSWRDGSHRSTGSTASPRSLARVHAGVVFGVVLLLAAAPHAVAEDVSYIAETRDTAKRQGAVNAGNVAWQCEGTRCIGIGPWATPPVSLCAALAREIGPMQSFAQFSSTDLASCNAAAAMPPSPKAPVPDARPPAKTRPPGKPLPGSGQA
jgi:hypothetical protein